MTIGEKIKALRQDTHMTQEALAREVGVTAQAVSKWEQGTTAPDISLLGDIAAVFSVTTDELLGAGRHKTASGYRTYRERLLAVYEETGSEADFQKAAAAYEDVLLRGRPETGDYMHYGYLYNCRVRRDLDLALRYYEKALEHGKNDRDWIWFQTHQQISLLYAMQGRAGEAAARWEAWLAEEPENYQACLACIWALYYAGQAEEALPFLNRAVELEPEHPAVLTAYGDILGGCHGLGRYEEAIAYWDRAQQQDDSYGDVRWSRAYAYEQLGRYPEAIEEYKDLCLWLERRGYDAGVETLEPTKKIQELTEKLRK